MWHMLICLECDGDDPDHWLPMPFTSPAERGQWAAAHSNATGHDVWYVYDQPKQP